VSVDTNEIKVAIQPPVLEGVIEHEHVGVQGAHHLETGEESVSTHCNHQALDGLRELQWFVPGFLHANKHLFAVRHDAKGTRCLTAIAS